MCRFPSTEIGTLDTFGTRAYNASMPDEKMNRIHVTITDAEIAAIDDWGFSNRVRTRAEAIRRLVSIGIAASTKDDALATISARAFSLSTADGLPEFIEDELEAIADALDDLRKALKTPKA